MRNLAQKFLSAQAHQQIDEAVKEAERKTSGEIVCMIQSASYHYPMANVIGATALALPISLAITQGAPPEPFAIAIAFAVMAGYITPLTDGDNLLVREPGHYTMRDYVSNTLPIFLFQTVALMTMLALGYGLW